MNLKKRICYHTWNIGFIEREISDVILSDECQFQVKWIIHNYKDRFFADPFILEKNDKEIKVIVEEYPFFRKKGIISLLTINRDTYELIERKVVLEQPYHMSYPYIYRTNDNKIWIAPEASMSGCLYKYTMNPQNHMLENQELLINEPVVDSTIIQHDGKYWLFCTKRGEDSNRKLYIYHSKTSFGPWTTHHMAPAVDNCQLARPAGSMIKINGSIYRVVQKNDKSYGEAINVTRIDKLSVSDFKETFIKQICAQKDRYSCGFHTINGYEDICVVDGLHKEFAPFRRLLFEFVNIVNGLWRKCRF